MRVGSEKLKEEKVSGHAAAERTDRTIKREKRCLMNRRK